jgi:hypothetical protein
MQGYFRAGCELGVVSWVFARPVLYELVIAGLADLVESTHQLYLVTTPEELQRRPAENDRLDLLEYALSRLQLIDRLPCPKLDISNMTPDDIAEFGRRG